MRISDWVQTCALPLSSPSGAGKPTISRMLLADADEISLSVSVTTRPPRPGEVDGVHYHFVDHVEFDRMIAEDDFYEWAHVFAHRYGQPNRLYRTGNTAGQDLLLHTDHKATP